MKGFKELPSTNEYLKEHESEYENFDSIVTFNQTQGKGRTGHTWESEPGKNVAMSMIIKDDKIIKNFNMVSIVTGLVVAEYLINLGLEDVTIKWPNDIYVKGKKICGILLEGNLPKYLIIGIGINVNQEFFGELNATSIVNEINYNIEPSLVAADVADLLKEALIHMDEEQDYNIERYEQLDYLLNKTISFNYNGELLEGIAKGIDFDGSLKVLYNNKLINISTNEVNLVRRV